MCTDDGRCYISLFMNPNQIKDYTNSLELSNAARSLFFNCIAEQKVGGAIGNVGRSHHQPRAALWSGIYA